MKQPIRRLPLPGKLTTNTLAAALSLTLMAASIGPCIFAQTPCPEVSVLADGLLAPSKVIQTPLGNFLVSENGTGAPNTGRISIVDSQGIRRTLLEGLPSGTDQTGGKSGTSALWLRGRTLFVVNGLGDVTLPGPLPGTEMPNPHPSSPIFSSVLEVHFSASMEQRTSGVALTLADHQALKNGKELIRSDADGHKMTLRLVVDFPDYAAEPMPTFPANVRHCNPYGIVAEGQYLYVIDAGFNLVRKVDITTGVSDTLVTFPRTPNPAPTGKRLIENVPTSIHPAGGQLLVTLLSGAPSFLPGYSQVWQVDPDSGMAGPLVEGLSLAIDTLAPPQEQNYQSLLTLEYDLNFPKPGPGRLQFFATPTSTPSVVSACLVTPTSMVYDVNSGQLVIAQLGTGQLVVIPLEIPSL
jgi:hypothetical protein